MSKERAIDIPLAWGGIIPTETFVSEANTIVERASDEGVPLRLMGGVAIRLHSQNREDLAKRLGRMAVGVQEFTDLDFMSYRKYRDKMKSFFGRLGYQKRRATLSSAASERQIYFHPKGWFYVDVFFDKLLVANHPLDFRNRLELDSPTVSVTDLLLEKLQIVRMGEKDAKDAILLLAAHEIALGYESDTIHSKHVANLLANDWGFYYTVTTNLRALKAFSRSSTGLRDREKAEIAERIDALSNYIENEPKSLRWKMRAALGSRKRWYEVVETSETVGDFGIWRLVENEPR